MNTRKRSLFIHVSDGISSKVSTILAIRRRSVFSAFTIAELVVVITILAILATVGFLALSGYSEDARDAAAKSNARSVYSAISAESAITGNSPRYYVKHDPAYALSGWIVAFDGSPTSLSWGDWDTAGTNYSAGNPDYAKLKLNPERFRVATAFPAADFAMATNPRFFIVWAVDVRVWKPPRERSQSFVQVAWIIPSWKIVVTGNYSPPTEDSVEGLVLDPDDSAWISALIDGRTAWSFAESVTDSDGDPLPTYLLEGEFANGSWAVVTVCWQTLLANGSWSFSLTVEEWSTCSDVTAELAGYSCSTFNNWPSSVDANVSDLGGECQPLVAWVCLDQTRIVNGRSYPVPETPEEESATVEIEVPISYGVSLYRQVFECSGWTFQSVGSEAEIAHSCEPGYSYDGSNCADLEAPSGGSFSLPTYSATQTVTVPITCPSDAVSPLSQIQFAIGNAATPTNWSTCVSSVSHALTAWFGSKDVYVRFRDAAWNVTPNIRRTTDYSPSTVSGACLNLPANAKFFGWATSYSLSAAAPGTNLEAAYSASPQANTCQYQCDSWYVDNGGTCALFKFSSHTFTNCGVLWRTWPSLVQCQTSYVSAEASWWKGTFLTMPTNGIQEWTVPETATYRITAVWAKGWNARGGAWYLGIWGNGSSVTGDFNLTVWQKIRILVGQMWPNTGSSSYWAWGGGGSFVTTSTNSPLVIAWGGGWASSRNLNGLPATVKKSGAPGYSSAGGTWGGAASWNGGGAGLTGNWSKGNTSFTNGGLGSSNTVNWWFWGGGGGNSNSTWGGGGYSGGGASTDDVYQAWGGWSFNASTSYQSNFANIGTSHGWVTVELRRSSCPAGYYCPDGTPQSKVACPVGKTSPSGSVLASQCQLYLFATETFGNCTVTGRTWPTVAQCVADSLAPWMSNTAYYSVGHVQWIQLWTVPKTGNYAITAAWAKWGWRNGGRWAVMKGTFALTEGQKIKILVWQMWAGTTTSGAGGGWSFVTTDTNLPLIVAWAGGWQIGTSYYSFADGTWSTSASAGKWSSAWLGWISGNGGKAASSYWYGGGGLTGESDNLTYGWRAYATTAGWGYYTTNAGFWGGGGARYYSTTTCTSTDVYGNCLSSTTTRRYGAWGGGGYSGWGGGYATSSSSIAWGGGGSYNSWSSPQSFLGTSGNSSHGYVTIELQP